jgi:hypothetical protein
VKLAAADPQQHANYDYSVAMSRDGQQLAVGSPAPMGVGAMYMLGQLAGGLVSVRAAGEGDRLQRCQTATGLATRWPLAPTRHWFWWERTSASSVVLPTW